jgi:hypothetical protein
MLAVKRSVATSNRAAQCGHRLIGIEPYARQPQQKSATTMSDPFLNYFTPGTFS